MRFLLLILCTLIGFTTFSQDIIVDTIVFTETIDSTYKSNVPFVIHKSGTKTVIVERINEGIKDHFMINSFNPDSVTEFRWYNIDFQYVIESNILLIHFTGDYLGPYLSSADENLYFDLSNGHMLEETLLPFQSLFSLEGYFLFLDKYWLAGCNREYEKAIECADGEPYCDCYEINFSSSENHKISFSLTDDCYSHAFQSCNPFYSVDISLDSLKPFLSEFGIYALFQKEYFKMSTIGELLFYKENFDKIPSYYFIVGKIDDKYPFSMAFEVDGKTSKAKGYYFYHKKDKSIKLEGEFVFYTLKLTESINNKITGRFEFDWNCSNTEDGLYTGNSKFCSGKWFNANNNEFRIKLIDIKTNK